MLGKKSAVMDDVDVGTTSEAGEDEAMDHFSMSFMFDDDEDNGDVTPAINVTDEKLKACPDFKEGDTISVLIPPNERSSTDLPRLPGVVTEAKGTSSRLYTIGTAHGILNIGYRTADLQIYSGQVDIHRDKTITLRKAVMLTNPTTLHTTKSCKCKGKCDTLRCPCKKSQITCSTHCHLSKPRENGEK